MKHAIKQITLRLPQDDYERLKNASNKFYVSLGVQPPVMSDNMLVNRLCSTALEWLKANTKPQTKK